VILTNGDGAALPETAVVEEFPILLRLHRDFFDFSQAHPDGDDLRFTTSQGQLLAAQLDHWNPSAGEAAVWIRVPRIVGNARQVLNMYWGNSAAQRDSRPVFDATNGYAAVVHLGEPLQDDLGTLTLTNAGTTLASGRIGPGRHFAEQRGIAGGEQITGLPEGSAPSSSSAWIRVERPNVTLLGWGNEQAQGKVVMQFRSPPHINMDCYFSDGNVASPDSLKLNTWTHVVHTYDSGTARIYVDGVLAATSQNRAAPLNVRNPARFWLGGWYGNYSLAGDLDEVRISKVARTADWIRLEFENQKPHQTLVGPLLVPGDAVSIPVKSVALAEGQQTRLAAQGGGAEKLTWTLRRGDRDVILTTDRWSVDLDGGRVSGPETARVQLRVVEATGARILEIPVTITDTIPDPQIELEAPPEWNGRDVLELVPRVLNQAALTAAGAGRVQWEWSIDGPAVIRQVASDRLILTRAFNAGTLAITVSGHNGGDKVARTIRVLVRTPATRDPWVERPLAAVEQPEDDQFLPREGWDAAPTGRIVYRGQIKKPADAVFVRVFADDAPYANQQQSLQGGLDYALSIPVRAGRVRYRTEFGIVRDGEETVTHSAANLICGDVYLIIGQSNAVATDFGKGEPPVSGDWVRTFGATDGSRNGSRQKFWANAVARAPGGRGEIGYWGVELGRRLVEQEGRPVCLINGAVGGTRIDQHLKNTADPTDVETIYGRLLWRVQQARLTHGVRAILWHQGENDQGADGPSGGFGWETYRQNFHELAGAWKQDYPNLQQMYVFQIWPKACAMGIRGSDNRLREVQRRLAADFSNLSVMSTVGVKPPGGCHFPAAGYAEFARMIQPVIAAQVYGRASDVAVTPPNLQRASFQSDRRDEIVLEFDSPVTWSEDLIREFHLEGAVRVIRGSADGTRLLLTLDRPSPGRRITYLDSASWSPDRLLYGTNGLAALTFCEVPIEDPAQ